MYEVALVYLVMPCISSPRPGLPHHALDYHCCCPGLPRAIIRPRLPRTQLHPRLPRTLLRPGLPRALLCPGQPRALLRPGLPRALLRPGRPTHYFALVYLFTL